MKNLCLILLFAFVVAGCGQKEQGTSNKVVQPEDMQIAGQIFIVTKGGENVVLGDVEVALFDQRQMWNRVNHKALQWSNSLAEAQAKVDQATTNYDALYKDDIDKFTTAKKYHDNIMQTAATGTPEWEQASEWSMKLEDKIFSLNELKDLSDAEKELVSAVRERDSQWDFINWPSAESFDLSMATTRTDSEGRFKFVVTPSSPNVVVFAKAERQVGDEKEKYWWLVVVGTPAGNEDTNLSWSVGKIVNAPSWYPNVNLKDKTTQVILSNNNKSDFGIYDYLENTNVVKYMLYYGAVVDGDKWFFETHK